MKKNDFRVTVKVEQHKERTQFYAAVTNEDAIPYEDDLPLPDEIPCSPVNCTDPVNENYDNNLLSVYPLIRTNFL